MGAPKNPPHISGTGIRYGLGNPGRVERLGVRLQRMQDRGEDHPSFRPGGRQPRVQGLGPAVRNICNMVPQHLRRRGVLRAASPGANLGRAGIRESCSQQVAAQNQVRLPLPVTCRWSGNGVAHQRFGSLIRNMRIAALHDGRHSE